MATKTKAHRALDEFADTAESDADMDHVCDVADGTASPSGVRDRRADFQHLPSTTSRTRVDSDDSSRVLTTASLLAICFFSTSGGPIGSEDLIIAGGPFVGLIAMLVFPFVFYIPLAYMVTELAAALPVSGGHAYWVALAFGPSWGFQAGYWSWVSNCIDCSMFASLTISSLVGPDDWIENTFWEFLFKSSFALLLALPGLWSLRTVAMVVLFCVLFVLIPYAALCFWAATEATRWEELLEIRRFNTTPTPGGDFVTTGAIDIQWSKLINVLVWGYNGFSNLSVLAAHVQNPAHTYWRVLWYSSLLIPLAYLIPFTTMTAIDKPDWRLWTDGSLGEVARTLAGDVMAGWIMVVDFVCSAGLYICGLTASAFMANGMAKQGIAPTTVGLSTSSGTPHGAIFCSLAVILVIINLQFDEMLQLANALGGLEAIAIVLAFIRLRYTMNDLPRPVRFCGNAHPVVPLVLLFMPLALYGYVIVDAFRSFTSAVLVVVFLFIGLVYARQADYSKFRANRSPTFE